MAGGKARRMGGVNKGAQLLGGRTLAGLVIERMKPQVKSIFISSNEFAAEFDSYGYPVFKKEPLHCLLHKDVLPSLTSFLDSNKRSVLGFLEHLGALELDCEIDEGDFMNLNTLEELELLNKTLEQELSDGS